MITRELSAVVLMVGVLLIMFCQCLIIWIEKHLPEDPITFDEVRIEDVSVSGGMLFGQILTAVVCTAASLTYLPYLAVLYLMLLLLVAYGSLRGAPNNPVFFILGYKTYELTDEHGRIVTLLSRDRLRIGSIQCCIRWVDDYLFYVVQGTLIQHTKDEDYTD
jgi:hypothetical protein